jgi:hypothetical protein
MDLMLIAAPSAKLSITGKLAGKSAPRASSICRPRAAQPSSQTFAAPTGLGVGVVPKGKSSAPVVKSRPNCALLQEAGVAAIYGPGTNIPVAASEVLHLTVKKRMAGVKRAKLA